MRIRGACAALAVSALLITTGCGSTQNTAAENDSAHQQSTTTKSVALTSDNLVSVVTKAQLAARTSHVQMTIGAKGESIVATGDVKVADSADAVMMAMKMTMPGAGEIEMRMIGSVIYVKLGPMSGDKFVKIDMKDSNNPLAKNFGDLSAQMDPSGSIKAFDGAITSLEKKGDPVRIDGVDAQPYKVVVDRLKMKSSPATGGAAGLPDEMSFMFWIGPDNLTRKMTIDVMGATVESTFTRWGEPVDVKAPSADQITDKSQMGSMMPGVPAA